MATSLVQFDRASDDARRRRDRRRRGRQPTASTRRHQRAAAQPGPLPDAVGALVTGGLALVLEPMATAIEQLVAQATDDVLVVVDLNGRRAAILDRDACVARLRR